jgi:prepilin-type N-terminal cleavage/methylation domain-containing protein
MSAICSVPVGRNRAAVRPRRGRGFTLIELLVVVAIIALLISILLPSLVRAREQARLTICKANSKQISTSMACYQTEYKGFVPVMFNSSANGADNLGGTIENQRRTKSPARCQLLSVAFRAYSQATRGLSGTFDPEIRWTDSVIFNYVKTIMPPFYACPFERNGGTYRAVKVSAPPTWTYYEMHGRYESYETWLWERARASQTPWNGATPPDGTSQYANFTWTQYSDYGSNAKAKNLHRQWSTADARKLKATGFSDVTVSYCGQGEYVAVTSARIRINVGSHRVGRAGGTNAIFADSHVAWVKGVRIGWP